MFPSSHLQLFFLYRRESKAQTESDLLSSISWAHNLMSWTFGRVGMKRRLFRLNFGSQEVEKRTDDAL